MHNDGFVPVGILKGFMSMQLRQDIKGNDDIVVIDDPDSTTGGAKKKKKKGSKKHEDSDKESNASEILGCSQRLPKCWHISSKRSLVTYEPLVTSPARK